MTFQLPDEWAPVLLALRTWTRDLGRSEMAGYIGILDDFDPALVLTAVKHLSRSGRTFYPHPTAADIAEVAETLQRPELQPVTWTEVWTAIQAAHRHPEFPRQSSPDTRAIFAGDLVASELGPIAGAWVAQIFTALMLEPLGDQSVAGAIIARYRGDWDAHQSVLRDRVRHGGIVKSPTQVLARGDRESVVELERRTAPPRFQLGQRA